MKSLMPQIDSNDGLFHNGNPATGEQGTRVTDTWLNNLQDRVRDVQAEAHYVLQKAGFTPKAETQTQLYQAIVKIIDDNRKTASLTQKGETKLYTGYDSQSEDLALTPKTAYQLKQLIDSNTRALGNVIPNSKKSSAVNSNSADTVATSAAVKTAYDKGVDAKDSADNANNNANGRVSKSGDTMIGMLKITSSSTRYKVNGYDWSKKIELSGDSMIGNEASVIGFNNNGTLHLGGKPNSSEFNASINETRLWVKGDVVTKIGASLNDAFMKTGGVVTGSTSFKQGDWSGIDFYNNSGRYVRVEGNPHSRNSMLSFVYRESNGSNINVAYLPRKDGNILLDADFTYQKIGDFEVRKYPDGTMIQTYSTKTEYKRPNNRVVYSFNWAVAFASTPLIFTSTKTSWVNNEVSLNISSDDGDTTNSKTSYWMWENNYQDGVIQLNFIAIGRWK